MKWDEVQHRTKADLKRLVGVTPNVFKEMVKEVKGKSKRKRQKKKREGPLR